MSDITTKDVLTEILKVDKDFYEEPVIYEFSNGKQFFCTDSTEHGIYKPKEN